MRLGGGGVSCLAYTLNFKRYLPKVSFERVLFKTPVVSINLDQSAAVLTKQQRGPESWLFQASNKKDNKTNVWWEKRFCGNVCRANVLVAVFTSDFTALELNSWLNLLKVEEFNGRQYSLCNFVSSEDKAGRSDTSGSGCPAVAPRESLL